MKHATVVIPVRGTATVEFEVDDNETRAGALDAAILRLATTPRHDIFELDIDTNGGAPGVCLDRDATESSVPG